MHFLGLCSCSVAGISKLSCSWGPPALDALGWVSRTEIQLLAVQTFNGGRINSHNFLKRVELSCELHRMIAWK